jgi:AcrR family transcriptional regulator
VRKSSGDELADDVRRSGRRTGPSVTRRAILTASRRQFAELGYDRASLRSIAAEAEVDQKLVGYFFGSKQALLVEATELPFEPGAVVEVIEGDPAGRGRRLAQMVLRMLENPETGPRLVGIVRAAAAEPAAANQLRELLERRLWGPAAERLPVSDPHTAVGLLAMQILGLVMSRYVIRAEPMASFAEEEVVELIAPSLQRVLWGDDGAESGA